MPRTQVTIPTLVRVKAGALDRVGLYASRLGASQVVLLNSQGLPEAILQRCLGALEGSHVALVSTLVIENATFEQATQVFATLPSSVNMIVGLGGGKALDLAKYVAFLGKLPYLAVPTSLSNDGFCSPQSSLLVGGRRKSCPAALPAGVAVDTEVCLEAPLSHWCSGVGDLASKLTACEDWRRAFHAKGTPIDDFSWLLADATVFQFMARPVRDLEGVRLLATALLVNGIAMEICGSSRPASGAEHLVSHYLDAHSARPRLHGLQVGMASYLVSHLQGQATESLRELFQRTGFFDVVEKDPFSRAEWLEAFAGASGLRPQYHTVLDELDPLPRLQELFGTDPILGRCFGE